MAFAQARDARMGGDMRGRKRRDRPAVPIWTPAFAGEGNFLLSRAGLRGEIGVFAGFGGLAHRFV